MADWARSARWVVAAGGLVFLAVVFASLRERERPVGRPPVPATDPQAEMEVLGATSRQWSGTDERFTVRSTRQLAYRDGSIKYEGMTVYVDDLEGNRQFVATAHEGHVNGEGSHVVLTGDVRLVSTDGLAIDSQEASYDTGDRIIRAPGPVAFEQGRLTGRGVGMAYDRSAGRLRLQEQSEIFVAPDEEGLGRLAATAVTAVLVRQDHFVRFEQDVVIRRAAHEIRSDTAVGYLTEDESSLTSLDLRGHAQIESAHVAVGAMKTMRARDISLGYAADGEHLERATLDGNGVIEIAGASTDAGRQIEADWLDVRLDEDGTTVASLTGREHVVLAFPADGDSPAQTIRATSIEAGDGPGGGLTSARLRGEVAYREEPVGADPRVVRSGALDLGLTPGLAGITGARFSDAVRFEQGELHAAADAATYAFDAGAIELESVDGGGVPSVEDTSIWIQGRTITLGLEGQTVAAAGAVRSQLKASADGSGAAGTRMPGFLSPDEAVNVTADALDYDGAAARADYRGASRLWQGQSAVQGAHIVIDTQAGNLMADGSVRTSLLVGRGGRDDAGDPGTSGTADEAGAPSVEAEPAIGAAEAFEYDDTARQLIYTTRAHVVGPQGDLVGDRIELFLLGDTNELERAEAYESVTLRDGGRTATGERLTYVNDDGRYDVSGLPVRIVEGCRVSTGRTLTFYKDRDEISIDGQQFTRTRTRSEGECSEPTAGRRAGAGAGG